MTWQGMHRDYNKSLSQFEHVRRGLRLSGVWFLTGLSRSINGDEDDFSAGESWLVVCVYKLTKFYAPSFCSLN